jgi:hypothetical protein
MGLGYRFWALKMTMAQWAKNYLIENFFFFFSKHKTQTNETNGPKPNTIQSK